MVRAEPLRSLDATALRRWAVIARAGLAAAANTIDALNVFPVPDADTGTNLLLTFEQALLAERFAVSADAGIAELTDSFARAAVLSARGNSGVILSQLARGVAAGAAEEHLVWGPAEVAAAMRLAADHARSAVAQPQDGTILSVADAAAAAAQQAATGTLAEVVDAALAAAHTALDQSTSALPALQRAGVVDAGGAGLLVLLQALASVVDGRPGLATTLAEWAVADTVSVTSACDLPADDAGPGYEVMLVLENSTSASVAALEADLMAIGDSVVIAGDDSLRSVHVHTDHVAAALERAARAGTVGYPEVTRFADQAGDAVGRVPLLVITESPGLAALAAALGAGVLEHQRLDPTVGEMVDALAAAGGGLVVASTAGGLAEARAAGGLVDDCFVVPATSPVTAALAVQTWAELPPGTAGAEAAKECTEVIADTAVVDLRVDGGDLAAATRAALQQVVTDDTEIVTIVRGAHADWRVLEEVLDDVRRSRPQVSTQLLLGGSAEIAASVGAE
ncbi:DAK2 domain-containing protein [Branchiibius sp. NY16-3462-2]|uniref:DAK2 domain-containing protein n=1 Tax=Branchiibius sp. NY16-3462-2 TaxID=1807500 RepID=UPI000791A2AE|nr:DAK2 domain-containing protein [Branchiibius sp. NY16-3462-2]KYH43304.1 hypothetical protein AZH51_13220 [Branchiibius sp. NY16-3462-2]